MGYLTIHVIRIINKYNTRNNLIILNKILEKISGYSFDIVGSTLTDFTQAGYKWYTCQGDMMRVSSFLPKFEIQIEGEGEKGETWKYIYKNGNVFQVDNDKFSEPDSNSDFCEETESNHCSYEEKEEEEDDDDDHLFEDYEDEDK